jgi:hypothetical protein
LKNNFIDKFDSYKSEQYTTGITNAKLAVVALLKLEENDIEKTFENVVVTLQRLFPGKFSLITYPDIPDTIRVDNTLRLDAQKHSKYLTGNRPKGYKLTANGRIAADETINELTSSKRIKGKKSILSGTQRNRYTKLVSAVTQSECFEKFSTKQLSEIKKFDVRRVLQCTLETPDEKAKANLEALKSMATALNAIKEYEILSRDVLEFLKYLTENWEMLQND